MSEKIDKLRAGRDEVAALAGTLDEMRDQIFILEAHAGQRYWEAISSTTRIESKNICV
ncbi:MAG: hypothetical protein ABFS56_16040 [Pseudomonadota bacterium]